MLTKKMYISDVVNAGDYCFVKGKEKPLDVVMACPACAGVFICHHQIVQQEPLTLSPSVLGPEQNYHDQILGPCGHHFWVKDGEVIDLR